MDLRIGHLSTFYHTAILLMAEGKPGIQWRLFGNGPAIVNAFEKGELDIAYCGLPPAVTGIARGVPITCIAGGHMEGTVLCGKRPLRDYADVPDLAAILGQFRGLRIGVPGKGSIHDVILKDALQKAGLTADVAVVNFAWADQVLEAVVHDEVAAAIGTPALAAAVKYYVGGKVLYPPSKLWPNNPSYGIIADRSLLDRQRDMLAGFLRAHEDATAFLRNRRGEAAKIIAGYIGFADEELVLDALNISPKYCAQLTDEYMASTMEFVKTQRALGFIGRDVTADEIFDASLICEVHGPGGHYGDVV